VKVGEDRRLKVLYHGRAGAVEKMLSKAYCTVQFPGSDYYVLCAIDDLTPISEEEYRRKVR
jgi:hypothetical protein